MSGFPVTRVSSADGRWAYTLYDGAGKHPFIHALDTRERKAVCIDLDGPAFAAGGTAYDLRLAFGSAGARLDVRREGSIVATVQTATFRVRTGAAAVAAAGAARAGAAVGDPAGPSLLWLAVGAAARRRAARAPIHAPPRAPAARAGDRRARGHRLTAKVSESHRSKCG